MNMDALAELERLADLKSKGVLTDAEFGALKAKLLSSSTSVAAQPWGAGMSDADETLIRRLATYEQVSGIVWLIIAALQILVGVTVRSDIWLIVAGVWNTFAALSGFAMVKRIRARDAGVPKAYEGMVQLVIIGLINLFVGGVIGVVWVGFDFFVRWQVLKNRRLFAAPKTAAAPPGAPPAAAAVPVSS